MVQKKRPQILTYLFLSVAYLSYWISGLMLILFGVIGTVITYPFGIQRRFFKSIFYHYLHFFVDSLLPFYQIYKIKSNLKDQQFSNSENFIFVANHCGKLDGLLLLAYHKNLIPTMKSFYTKRPVYYIMTKLLGMVSLNSSSYMELPTAIADCKNILNNGNSLLMFPEGTRSYSNKILPFKPLAFKLSIDTGIPIFPVIITSELPFMSKTPGSYFPVRNFNFNIKYLHPILPIEDEKPVQFAGRLQKIYVDNLRSLV